MRETLFATIALVALSSGGCLFSEVGENLEQSSCRGQPKSFCDELNQLSPTGDSCLEWSCSEGEGVCKVLPFDGDDDGAPMASCEPPGVEPDCDDNDPSRKPKVGNVVSAELCDGVDNDCDLMVDEGAYEVAVVALPVIIGLTASVQVLPEESGSESGPIISYSKQIGGIGLHKAHVFISEESVVESGGLEFDIQSSAVGRSDEVGETPRLISALGRANGGRELIVGVLANASGGVSELTGVTRVPNTVGYDAISLAIAPGSGDFVGSYIDANAVNNQCGAIGGVQGSQHPVRLFAGDISSGGVTTLFGDDLDLAVTSDPSASPVLATADNAWLVAVAAVSSVEVYPVITLSAGKPVERSLSAGTPITISTDDVPGEVDLAMSEDGSKVAIAFREGCGQDTIIRFGLFTRNTSTGALSDPEMSELATNGGDVRRPHVLWREAPSPGWLVSWQEQSKRGQIALLSQDGEAIGELYTLIDDPSFGFNQGFMMVPTVTDSIAVYAPGIDGVQEFQLTCAGE